jgi:hypothetical protein
MSTQPFQTRYNPGGPATNNLLASDYNPKGAAAKLLQRRVFNNSAVPQHPQTAATPDKRSKSFMATEDPIVAVKVGGLSQRLHSVRVSTSSV